MGNLLLAMITARYQETNATWTPDSICANCGCHSSWHSLTGERFIRPASCNCLKNGCKCKGFVAKENNNAS